MTTLRHFPSFSRSTSMGMVDSLSFRSTPTRRPFLAVVALVSIVACGDRDVSWQSPVAFDTARVSVVADDGADTARLLVEVAGTDEQRGFGLMVRPELDPGSGMLFLYDSIQPDTAGFWMWRTRMPLDIAFMDSTGRVLSIRQMAPCESPYASDCPEYGPGEAYHSALEVNRGWFEEHGFGVGDRVVVDSMPPGSPPGSTDGP